MSAIGKIGVRSGGPAGCIVPGCSGGSGAPGRSGSRLIQCVGMRSSVRRNFVGVSLIVLMVCRPYRRGPRRGRRAVCDRCHACWLADLAANLLMAMSFSPITFPTRASRRARGLAVLAVHRLRPRLLPIAHTAAAAVVAWYLALVLLPDPRPAFASIAAVIAVGATYGSRGARAAQLIRGVVVRPSGADVLVRAIGVGPLQMGVMVVVAMSTAVVLGGGALLVTEAAVSALLLLATVDPTVATVGPGLSPIRFAEALIGGAVALGVTSLFFPPDPALIVGRAMQTVFGELGRSLERVAAALADADAHGARGALQSARDIDAHIDALDDAFSAGRETARLAPPRRRARTQIDRYGRTLAQVDFAVRNTRVLARAAVRFLRSAGRAPADLARAVPDPGAPAWELAAAHPPP